MNYVNHHPAGMSPEPTAQTPPETIIVEAKIALPGLKRGQRAEVERGDQYIEDALANGYVVPVRRAPVSLAPGQMGA